MEKQWTRPRIFFRILLVVVVAIILSTVLCSAAIYLYVEPIIRDSIVASNEDMVVKMLGQVSGSLNEVTAYATNVAFDDTLQAVLQSAEVTPVYARFSAIQRMERKLKEYVMLRDTLINDIFVADASGRVLEFDSLYSDIFAGDTYAGLREEERTGFTPLHTVVYNINGDDWDTVGYVSEVFNRYPPDSYIGKLIIVLNVDSLTVPLRFEQESGVCVELYSPGDDLVFSSDPGRNLTGEISAANKGRDHVFRYELEAEGWYALCSISGRQVSDSLSKITVIIIGIVAVCLAFMLTILSRITTNIVKPLETLVSGMRQVANGSRTEHIVVNTHDEIEDAARMFNQMVEDINRHTQDLLDSEKKEHESRLQTLIYQINPHFIYNTLNCVICLARSEDHDSIIRLTRVFITFLRTILRVDTKSLTTLGEEISYMDLYVRILQYSYRNVRSITWNVDKELEDITLPKLILYPLIENGIFYGVIPTEEESGVTVSARREGDSVTVSVRDTGRGMEPETLAMIRGSLNELEESRDHIGLRNVNSRLKLIYGESAGLRVESEFGAGTEVSFTIDHRKLQ